MPKQTKASPTPPPAAAVSDAGAVLNKAKAAYDQYRKTRTSAQPATSREGWGGPVPGFPPGMPVPPGAMPAWGAPPPGAAGTPFGIPWPTPGAASALPATLAPTGPLFESVGQMLQLGVAFATAAFAGGLQAMQGFTGSMYGGGGWATPPQAGGCHPATCACGCDCGHAACDDCGCGCSCGCDTHGDCCRPGVRNCSCCC